MPRWMAYLLALAAIAFVYTNPEGAGDIAVAILNFVWNLALGVGTFFARIAQSLT